MHNILLLIDAWRQALRAAQSEDYAGFRNDYARRAEDYARCIRANVGRLRR